MTWTFNYNDVDYIIRILLSALCGLMIGAERERHFKAAGIRTHIIVAISSALMMIISKYGFNDVIFINETLKVDASRVASGVVSAIGFLGAGVIFIKKGNVSGVTTAAGLWATVGIGLAIGAGLCTVGLATTVIILILQLAFRQINRVLPPQYYGTISMVIPEAELSISGIKEELHNAQIWIRSMDMERLQDAKFKVKLDVQFPRHFSEDKLITLFRSKANITKINCSALLNEKRINKL